MALFGAIPAIAVFVAAFMWIEGRERWMVFASYSVVMTLIIYVVFDRVLSLPWPGTIIGGLFPALRAIPSI